MIGLLALAGCGSAEPRTAPIRVPAEATAACERLAATETVRVLCPPAGGSPAPIVRLRHDDLDGDPCTYVANLEALDPDLEDRRPSHLLYGGTCAPLPLEAAADGRWDIEPPVSLRLAGSPPLDPGGGPPRITRPHVVDRLEVRGQPGLLLRSDPFPEGGTNGSHYSLVWNEDGAGYQVSAHFATGDRGRDPRPDQREALLRFAEGLRPAS